MYACHPLKITACLGSTDCHLRIVRFPWNPWFLSLLLLLLHVLAQQCGHVLPYHPQLHRRRQQPPRNQQPPQRRVAPRGPWQRAAGGKERKA